METYTKTLITKKVLQELQDGFYFTNLGERLLKENSFFEGERPFGKITHVFLPAPSNRIGVEELKIEIEKMSYVENKTFEDDEDVLVVRLDRINKLLVSDEAKKPI